VSTNFTTSALHHSPRISARPELYLVHLFFSTRNKLVGLSIAHRPVSPFPLA
jgi:hypothetical protein